LARLQALTRDTCHYTLSHDDSPHPAPRTESLYEKDEARGLPAGQIDKIRRILARLDQAGAPNQMDIPGLRLHPLKGELAGLWSVTVQANWRIIFRFENGDVTDVDYLDYH
jgi:proteic killer suppression protein